MMQGHEFSDTQGALFAPDEAPEYTAPTVRVPSYIRDHRTRLRERFMQGGPEALPDYELLELLLFRAIPRKDVKPLARELLDRFGDFNTVVSAPAARLSEVKGVGDAVICELKLVEAAAHRLHPHRRRVLCRVLLRQLQLEALRADLASRLLPATSLRCWHQC